MASLLYEIITWWIGITAYALGAILSIIIAVVHTRHVCLDSTPSTAESSSTALKRSYNVISYCTLLSIYCYIWNMMISLLSAAPFVYELCPFIAINGSWSYLLAKMFMYLVFVWRLHAVYDSSAYRYSKTTLKIISVFILLFSLVLNILVTIRIRPYAGHAKYEYLRYCEADIDGYIAGLIALYDFGLSIYSCIAFVYPLRKVIKDSMQIMNTSTSGNEIYRTRSAALFHVGAKAAILTCTASVTTIIFMVLIGMNLASGLPPFDFVTNIICMVLMTGYYKRVYYRVLCCLPIRCSKCCMVCCCGFSENDSFSDLSTKQAETTETTPV